MHYTKKAILKIYCALQNCVTPAPPSIDCLTISIFIYLYINYLLKHPF